MSGTMVQQLILLVAFACVATQGLIMKEDLQVKWNEFKTAHNKKYSAEEEEFRKLIFNDNLGLIQSHNEKFDKGLVSYQMKIGKFADLLNSEYKRKVDCFISKRPKEAVPFRAPLNATIPDTVNWVTAGAVTPVKDQGLNCGSCYAFSATGAIEGQQFATQGLIPLSEQNLVDCSVTLGNKGCEKGSPYIAMMYVVTNVGMNTAADYNYTGVFSPVCKFDNTKHLAMIANVGVVIPNDEENLKQTVALMGPVSVGIDAGQPGFQNYGSGIYNDPGCQQIANHAVLVVGYGTENGQDYWLVKNSWGITGWGDQGYIKMSRNNGNQCFIAGIATFPYNQ